MLVVLLIALVVVIRLFSFLLLLDVRIAKGDPVDLSEFTLDERADRSESSFSIFKPILDVFIFEVDAPLHRA